MQTRSPIGLAMTDVEKILAAIERQIRERAATVEEAADLVARACRILEDGRIEAEFQQIVADVEVAREGLDG